jgi:hypothetical protein
VRKRLLKGLKHLVNFQLENEDAMQTIFFKNMNKKLVGDPVE